MLFVCLCEYRAVVGVFEYPPKSVLRCYNRLRSAIWLQAGAVYFDGVRVFVTRETAHKIRRIPAQNDRAIIADWKSFWDIIIKRNRVKKITRNVAVSDLLDQVVVSFPFMPIVSTFATSDEMYIAPPAASALPLNSS